MSGTNSTLFKLVILAAALVAPAQAHATFLTIEPTGTGIATVFSYPTITDVGNDTNAMLVGTMDGAAFGQALASSIIPEPSTGLLLATGLLGLAARGRRKRA
jgi:hypothetical protein